MMKMADSHLFLVYYPDTIIHDVYNSLGGKKMNGNYPNYGLDDIVIRNFMMPAVDNNQNSNMNMNMLNNNQTGTSKFVMPKEGFLRGNLEAGTYLPYKNMTYLKPVISNQKMEDLYKLQEIAFAAHDINLYLDTHPNDTNAINLYNEYNKQEKMLNSMYERKYGPLDLSDEEGLGMTPWSWINEPWPWNM